MSHGCSSRHVTPSILFIIFVLGKVYQKLSKSIQYFLTCDFALMGLSIRLFAADIDDCSASHDVVFLSSRAKNYVQEENSKFLVLWRVIL